MSTRSDVLERIERFRPYLRVLAQVQLGPRWHSRHDPSDLVQQTLVRAVAAAEQFRGQDDADLAGWLRRILATTAEG
jgi:DNA-directed RNA polymerase specialized sigma24 family protein